jgi:hypothetical protein
MPPPERIGVDPAAGALTALAEAVADFLTR